MRNLENRKEKNEFIISIEQENDLMTRGIKKKRESYGALFYARIKGKNGDEKKEEIYTLLGQEGRQFFPFKGCVDEGDKCIEDTASREVYEETAGVINIKLPPGSLKYKFKGRTKRYYFAIREVDYYVADKINEALKDKNLPKKFREKKHVKWFPLDTKSRKIHYIGNECIKILKKYLDNEKANKKKIPPYKLLDTWTDMIDKATMGT